MSTPDPYAHTLLKYLKRKRSHRDFLYQEFNDRNHRNEMLYHIYRNENIQLSDGTSISAQDNARNIYSATFEWYVAQLIYREFQFFASAFGVKIEGSPEGGDFDVIGATHSGIVAIECKSGKPRGIDEAQIQQFVKRHYFLRADYSILYIDYKGLSENFPFIFLSQAVHGPGITGKVFKIVNKSDDNNANFYAVEGANIYVVDNSKSTGNVIKNLRFAIDTHFALQNADNRSKRFNPDILKNSYGLIIEAT